MIAIIIILMFPISAFASDLSDYMDKEKFQVPITIQKELEKLEAWKAVVWRTEDGTPKYFVVSYIPKEEAAKIWKGEFTHIHILCRLVFSYEEKICISWFDANNREHKIIHKSA